MKKSKELSKTNEGKEYKKGMTKDKAAKIITREINTRAKLNKADMYLQLKNKSLEELKIIFKRVMQYVSQVDYTSSTSTRTIIGLDIHTLFFLGFALFFLGLALFFLAFTIPAFLGQMCQSGKFNVSRLLTSSEL